MLDLVSLGHTLPAGQIITAPDELLTYEMDASLERGCPNAVVFPLNTDDVVKIAKWAGERGIPLVARGAGTGISGGAVAERGGMVIEFSRMDRVLDFDKAGRRAVVQPGVINRTLSDRAQSQGLYYPPDPASERACTLGGNIAENAGGPHCFKYGVTTNYVTGLEIVLADGRRVRLGGRALDYPEYDFIGVLTGNEGTLAIITEAKLRLIGNPPSAKTMMAAFDAVEQAGEAVSAVIARGLIPAAMELMDQKMMRIVEDYAHPGLPVEAAAALIVEVDGWKESLSPQMDEIVSILRTFHPRDLRVAGTADEREQLWRGRKSVAGAITRLAPSYLPVDVTVPRSKLASTLKAIDQICAALGLPVGYVLHAGDGNVHPDIMIQDPADQELMRRVFDAAGRILELCIAQGGSITGEHGVGIEKRNFMPLMFSPDELTAMRDIKAIFDPTGVLNPGKIFPQARDRGRGTEVGGRALAVSDRSEPIRDRQTSDVGDIRESPRQTQPSAISHEPRSLQEAVEVIRGYLSSGQPRGIRIRGGGTKSALLPTADCLLSTKGLNGIYAYARDDLYVTVGAGTRLAELQEELARDRMWVPLVSPWSASTVGGIVASNFNGPLRMRNGYGGIRDQVLAATVVLPDARVIRAGRPLVKNVAGYDLVKLFVGSFGTLGLLTDVTCKITALPRARTTVIVPVNDLEQGLSWGVCVMPISLVGSALVLCSHCDLPGISARHALVYSAEGLAEDVHAEMTEVCRVLESKGASVTTLGDDGPSGSEIWCRWMLETPLPETVLRIGATQRELPALLQNDLSFVADLASGLVYARGNRDEMEQMRQIARAAGAYSVTLSAPTVPEDRSALWDYRPDALDLMRALKTRWDPQGLCNPGAFLIA